ncbi:hypothetical protein DFH08DRAFT_992352 [Mycena albidolilacea]|uniref:Uncharacterized protein n=1 Tax=Mycena albidolilacea TaxID=1033008 RepID=A0AAD7EV98_9AGAR|nr:hypothetical protein DFH08DRAFT_992352 [Mycena albidolilacea]
MNWSTLAENRVQPVRRGGADNSLFDRIGGRTGNNAVLITDLDRTQIKSSSTCTPSRRPQCIPSRPLRPLRSLPPALFHGHEDRDSDVYRPFVSGFDNNPVVSSAELPALLWWLPSNARASWLRRCRLLRFLLAGRFPVALLGWGRNWAFWAKVGRAKFTSCDERESVTAHAPAIHAAHALRARCTALSVLHRGDPFVPGAARALKIAYGMLIEDDWAGETLERSMSPFIHSASNEDSEYMRGKGKNRRQLAWAGARAFALRYVLERLYEGRYGERDADDDSDAEYEHAHLAWHVGWPRDTERAAAALWVLWFFEGEDTLRAEPEPLRRHIMDLLLPMVVAPFRYSSALAPPHHYTVPLLPAVYNSPAFNDHGRITVPRHHGAYPLYALGAAAPARARAPIGDRNLGPRPQAGPGAPRQRHGRRQQAQAPRRSRHPQHRPRPRARLLVASPARVLFFARMQATVRMGVPPHLPRDHAEAAARFREKGGIGAPPVGPTQADIHEKNARPSVRFERALPSSSSSHHRTSTTTMTTTTPTPKSTSACSSASAHRALAVDPELDLDLGGYGDTTTSTGRARRDARWAAHRGRAGLCRGYGSGSVASIAEPSSAAAVSSRPRTGAGGAPPGRIGQVYALGSFAGLWSGTMLMPSEGAYNALVGTPGGALPPGGLAPDDFVAAARPVYMRIREHWSFHPHAPAPPPVPDSTTADEGVGTGWLPLGTRFVGVGAGKVEVRVPAAAESLAAASAFGYGDRGGGGARRGAEDAYLYHTAGPGPPEEHRAHKTDRCPGCVGVRERERWARARAAERGWSPAASFGEGDVGREDGEHGGREYDGAKGDGLGSSSDASSESGSDSGSSAGQSSSTPLYQEHGRDSGYSSSDGSAPWPEWDAPAWAAHRFNEDEGWESGCDGVQDVVFEGETDTEHGMAWHHYEYAGRVRPWDGLIGLIMRPRDRTLVGLATYFISGHLVGRDTFEGTWQMAAQDVLAPSWSGSVCLARGEA